MNEIEGEERHMKFFSPTSELKELLLLQHIEKTSDTTQKEIANIINSAVSMVNVYIGKLEKKKYLVREYISPKRVYYRITSEGIKRKNFLSITYLHELLELYRLAEENIDELLDRLENKGYKKILLYGAGEVAETILGIIKARKNKSLKVLAIIDDDESRHHKELLGYKIISRDCIKKYEHDGIVITSYGYEDNIKDRLENANYPDDKVIRFFSE